MNLTIIIFVGLSMIILFLFYYISVRDKSLDRKFSLIERSLEDINREIYIISKSNDEKMRQIAENNISEKIETLIYSLNQEQKRDKEIIKTLENKINKMEHNLKGLVAPEIRNSNFNDIPKMKELQNQGYSIEEISKKLNIPVGEVDFNLKMGDKF